MAMEIFKLVGSIFVDNEAANESIGKTDKKAQGVGTTLANGVKTAAKWGAGIVAGASAAVSGIVAFSKKTAAATDEIDKMSQRLGVSRQAYQELDFVMSQSGVDVNSFQTGMKSLLKNMDAVAEGNKTAIANFEKLGVSATDTTGAMRDQETVLYETIIAFQGMEESAEKSRLAQELFGKQGQEILPLLNSQAGGFEEMRKQAHELGLVLDDETIDSGVVLTDTLDQLKRAFEGIVNRLGGNVMPLVTKVADYIIAQMPHIEALMTKLEPVINAIFDGLLPPLMELSEQILPPLLDLLATDIMPVVVELVQALLPIIVELLSKLLPPIIEIVQKLLPPLLQLLKPILDLLGPIIDLLDPILTLVVEILDPIAELISGLLTPLIQIISKLIEVALVPLKAEFTTASSQISNTFGSAIALIMNGVNTAKAILGGLIDFVKNVFTGNWEGAWEAIKGIFSNIWEGIKNVFKIPINWIIDGINAFIRGINAIKIPDWVPLVGGKGFNIGLIPNLEAGGILERGQTGLLEGNGAEAVVPLENNRKWISAVARDMETATGGLGGKKIEAVLTDILTILQQILRMGIYLDTGELVGGLAKPLDEKLGALRLQKARG